FGIARAMPVEELCRWMQDWQPDARWARLSPVNNMGAALLHAQVRHIAWMARVHAYLSGDSAVPPPLDVADCRFSAWIDTLPSSLLSDQTMQELRQLHQQVHALAGELCEAHAGGASSEPAPGLSGRLQSTSRQLQQRMQAILEHAGMADGSSV
ncbi:MAG: CZB domain-containing protein, partial [Chromatocurvus sp.]